MAFIHECSCECTKSELDLFSVAPTQTSVEVASCCDYHPLTSVTDDAPIEFEIGGTGEDYIDLANTFLYVKVKITKQNAGADDVMAPGKLFLAQSLLASGCCISQRNVHKHVRVSNAYRNPVELRRRRQANAY